MRILPFIGLGLTRLPRIAFLAAVAMQFGVTRDTDSFFLIYGVALFLVGTITYAGEILAPQRRTLWVGAVGSGSIMLLLAWLVESPLALLFVSYVIAASIASVLLGTAARSRRYAALIHTGLPYLVGSGLVFLLSDLADLVLLMSGIEVARVAIGYVSTRGQQVATGSWSYGAGMIAAAAIGGSAIVVDRLFATILEEGAVSHVGYAYGAILAAARIGAYGASIQKINYDSAPPVRLATLAGAAVGVGCAVLAVIVPEYRPTFLLATLLSPLIPLNAVSASLCAQYVVWRRWLPVGIGASLQFVVNVVGDAALIGPLGIYGIGLATLVAQAAYIWYLFWFAANCAGSQITLRPSD